MCRRNEKKIKCKKCKRREEMNKSFSVGCEYAHYTREKAYDRSIKKELRERESDIESKKIVHECNLHLKRVKLEITDCLHTQKMICTFDN